MEKTVASAGNSGPRVRSDCEVTLGLKQDVGIIIDLESKVKTLYGNSIRELAMEVLDFFGIGNAELKIRDAGALPFVIAARLEAAVKQLVQSEKEYLPRFIPENLYSTSRDRFRFSRLYLPGNTPALMINAGLHSADGIILDLEDSVAPDRKDEARFLVRNALRQVDFYGAERMVRINQGERGLADLHFVIPHNVNLILIPKCESSAYIARVEEEIGMIRNECTISGEVFLMPVIETALGVERSFEICNASPNIVAVAIGLEDYTSDLGVQRTQEGKESLYARTRIVVAARAANIQPIDSVFSDIDDLEGLRQNVINSRALGFAGMGCIHPRQIQVIKHGFMPDAGEIEKSRKIVLAFEEARRNGLGVVALGSKMIDPPVVERAQRTLGLAVSLGLLQPDWMESEK